MPKYEEHFVIAGHEYGIEHLADGSFRPWKNGSCIGTAASIEETRKVIHTHAVCQLRAEIDGWEARTESAKIALKLLGNDPFRLGRFESL